MPKRQTQRIIDSRKRNSGTIILGTTGTASVVDDGLYLLADGSRDLTGNLSVDSGVTIDGVDISAHAANASAHHAPATAGTMISIDGQQVSIASGSAYQFIGTASDTDAGWVNMSTLAGSGLTHTSGVLAVGAGDGISVAADAVAVADTIAGNGLTWSAGVLNVNVSGLGLGVGSDAVSLSSSSNPGAMASILATDASGYLTLVRLILSDRLRAPLIDTASGNLTLQPASGVVSLPPAVAIQTSNYASQLTGWRATYAGEGDFRYLFADELHAKSFIADLEQALAGGQIISKSVAVVATAFTVPSAGASATLRVRDLPSAANMAAFQSGDIVRLRTFSRSGGSLIIADAWGTVTSYADQSDGTQIWTFTRSTAPNAGSMAAGTVIQPDSIVLDYGASGNGFYEVNAIDGDYGLNSPYARIVTWTTHPATGSSLRVQMGNLRGVYGYASTVHGIAMGDPTGANVTVEATNGVRLRQGVTDMIVLDTAGNSYFAGVMSIGTSGEIRQGTGTLGSNYTGLRLWRDSNVGRIGGYNNNVLQWYGDTAGNFVAGVGYVLLNANGIFQTVANVKSDVTEPSSAPVTPVINQRVSFYDSADSADWGYTYPGGSSYPYFYPGMEWLRLYVSSQHFVQPQPYTTSLTENYHVYDAVIEMPSNTLPSYAGDVTRRRLMLKGPSVELRASDIAIGDGSYSRTVCDAASYYAPRVEVNTSGGWARQFSLANVYSAGAAANFGGYGTSAGVARSFWTIASSDPYLSTVGIHLLSTGYVGIGKISPAAELDVNGRILAVTTGYDWSELTPGGGWANYGGGSATFGVRRFGDMVSIKGVLKATSSIGSGATVYTLPAEYRPSTLRQFPTYGSNGADRILISSTGAIQLSGSYATNQYVLVETTYFTGG